MCGNFILRLYVLITHFFINVVDVAVNVSGPLYRAEGNIAIIREIQITLKKTIQSKPVGKFEREIQIVSMAPKRQYKGTRKMIDGQIGSNANLTKLLFQLLQMIHHIPIMRTQA